MTDLDVCKTNHHRNMIGVLNLQGDVVEHLDHLERIGIGCVPVKHPEEFNHLRGLIIPGGESTCIARLLRIFGIDQVIMRRHNEGMKLWGTCAGAILLAASIKGETSHLGLMDIEIERNSFGSQLDSFTYEAVVPGVSKHLLPLTFIRAPKITGVGRNVNILLRMNGFIAAAESDGVLVTVFHPELTPSCAFHRYFAVKCGLIPYPEEEEKTSDWNMTSWTRRSRLLQAVD